MAPRGRPHGSKTKKSDAKKTGPKPKIKKDTQSSSSTLFNFGVKRAVVSAELLTAAESSENAQTKDLSLPTAGDIDTDESENEVPLQKPRRAQPDPWPQRMDINLSNMPTHMVAAPAADPPTIDNTTMFGPITEAAAIAEDLQERSALFHRVDLFRDCDEDVSSGDGMDIIDAESDFDAMPGLEDDSDDEAGQNNQNFEDVDEDETGWKSDDDNIEDDFGDSEDEEGNFEEDDGIANDGDSNPRSGRTKRALLQGSAQYQHIENLKAKWSREMKTERSLRMYTDPTKASFVDYAPHPSLSRYARQSISPDSDYKRDVVAWVPHLLMPNNTIICPCCNKTKLQAKGWQHNPIARRVLAMDTHYHLVSYEYYCPQCKKSMLGSTKEVRSKLSTWLAGCFPAVLTQSGAIDHSLYTMLRGFVARGFPPHRVRELIVEATHERKEFSELLWLAMVNDSLQVSASQPRIDSFYKTSKPELTAETKFSHFNDRNKYDGAVPSTKYITSLYGMSMMSQRERIKKRARLFPVRILMVDDSHKVPKHLAKRSGVPMFTTLRSVANNRGELLMFQIQSSKSQTLTKPALASIEADRILCGHSPTELVSTDNVKQDRAMFEEAFPSLRVGIVSVEPPSLGNPQLKIPEFVSVRYLQHESAINEAIEPLLSMANSGTKLHVSLDAEWNYSHFQAPGRLACIQIGFEETILILHIFHLKRLPCSILALLKCENIVKIGRNIGGDISKICRDWAPELNTKESMKELKKLCVELGSFCKNKGVLVTRNGRVGVDGSASLNDLSNAVLKFAISKDLRESNWEQSVLDSSQQTYCALDVWASLQIYERVLAMQDKNVFKLGAGTKISVLSLDRQFEIADAVVVSQSKKVVTAAVSKVFFPSAVVTKSSAKSLGIDLEGLLAKNDGKLPFNIEIERSRVRLKSMATLIPDSDPTLTTPNPTPPIAEQVQASELPQLFEVANQEESDLDEFEEFLSIIEPVPFDSDSVSGPIPGNIDDFGLVGDIQTEIFERDEEFNSEAIFNELEKHSFITDIYSRVCSDPFHIMKLPKAYTTHPLYYSYLIAFRDALFIMYKEDVDAVTEALAKLNPPMSFEEKYRLDPRWILERVRRWIPPPQLLYSRVELVFKTFGYLRCPKRNKPLFNNDCWKQAGNVLFAIKQGYVGDPPGVQLYENKYRDRLGLMVRTCARGTPFLEGGVHRHVHKASAGYNWGARLSICFLEDYHGRHCIKMDHYRQTGKLYVGHFNYELKDDLHGLYQFLGLQIPEYLRNWVNSTSYSFGPSNNIGIATLPEAIRVLYKMERSSQSSQNPLTMTSAEFVAKEQNLKYAAFPVHTSAERRFFRYWLKDFRDRHPLVKTPDFQAMARTWNESTAVIGSLTLRVDGQTIFYKLPEHLELHYSSVLRFNLTEVAKAASAVEIKTFFNCPLLITPSIPIPDEPIIQMEFNVQAPPSVQQQLRQVLHNRLLVMDKAAIEQENVEHAGIVEKTVVLEGLALRAVQTENVKRYEGTDVSNKLK
ncbi:hypothetical protein HDU79_011705 [Rhizoclosmatium sp. JEL0117]|nr:hypothetical protein HDU79_011705 [Rhizoclosmatium sp. JEL0117]